MIDTPVYTRRSEFLAGMKDTIPMIVGAIPFGLIFGAYAITESGLSAGAVMGLSLFVFAGSSQFIGAQLVTQGLAMGIIILTTLVINLRHALYGASLAPYIGRFPQRWLLPLAFWLTDETYAVVIRRYQQNDDSPYKHWYHLGSSVLMYVNWNLCTAIGILAGQQVEGLGQLGLDFAMVVTFTGIIVPLIIDRPMLICAVVAAVTAVLANELPNKLGLMLAAVLGIMAGFLVETWQINKGQAVPVKDAVT